MDTNLYEFETEPSSRPSFLTALCILTFIGSGWGILSSIWTYSTASQSSKIFSDIRHEAHRDSISREDSIRFSDAETVDSSHHPKKTFELKMGATLSKMFTEENIKKGAAGSLIAAILTLSGALLMWQLKKSGFYLYIGGVLVALVVPLIIYGNNFLAVGISSFSGFFGLIFIALYALNLKSMDR